ncbi:MAG: cysteine peptidase family C39 domain-containing protein, partial [Pseudomonadota bacterium]|nr:cysteine peptidase family C39 domain-containing protein [Pseudomonadota bacterium]
VSVTMGTEALISTPTLKGTVAVKSWKQLRDAGVVKQDLDYSCGAASVATIMNGFYGFDVTEEALLETMAKDGAASFSDMAEVVRPYGLKGAGVALNFEQLRKLKTPAIAYLRYRDDDHFSVIRGIGADGSVQLADPSWGNRRFTQQQFLDMWETREGEALKGKILLLLPDGVDQGLINSAFFGADEHNPLALERLVLRNN